MSCLFFQSLPPDNVRSGVDCHIITEILLGRPPDKNRCLDDCFADILLYRRFPLIFALISAKIVKKSKNINDDERIVWYNKGGQKGAG